MVHYSKGGIAHKHDVLKDVWAQMFCEKQCTTNRGLVLVILNDIPHEGNVNEDVIYGVYVLIHRDIALIFKLSGTEMIASTLTAFIVFKLL